MISATTIERIWKCQREIDTGKKLLEEMKEIAEKTKREPYAERIRDAFGCEQDLQIGIPCGNSGHRLLNVSPTLAVSIITVHIANKEAELVEANEIAKIEIEDARQESKVEKQASVQQPYSAMSTLHYT
jgi:hypothetical protein